MKQYSKEKIYTVLGIMSGTSLDGLDLALCDFGQEQQQWNFKILKAATFDYPEFLAESLRHAQHTDAFSLIELHKDYGEFIAESVNKFLSNVDNKPVLIASHGHTVLHYPQYGINFQIGDGAVIAANTGIDTVCDFRSLDIALGGQGAPLVPVGDLLLFGQYDLFLNIGGFSNVTVKKHKLAFDICPANYALNYFANKAGEKFDAEGEIGRSGVVNKQLLSELNQLEYYRQKPPKSLSDHEFYEKYLPVIQKFYLNIPDILATLYEHIALQIAKVLDLYGGKVLVTGGGAKNTFLMEKIAAKTSAQLYIPEQELVDYKEAVIFAFLGLLRYLGQTNTLAEVTGASRNSSGGALYCAF